MDHDEGWPDWPEHDPAHEDGPTDELTGGEPAGFEEAADDAGAEPGDFGPDEVDGANLDGADLAEPGPHDVDGPHDADVDGPHDGDLGGGAAGHGAVSGGDLADGADHAATGADPGTHEPAGHEPVEHEPVEHDSVEHDAAGHEATAPDQAEPGPPDSDHSDQDSPQDSADEFGADLDSPGDHDSGWHDDEFPAELDFGPHAPLPHDGYPWSDPDTLGHPEPADATDTGLNPTGPADPQDLFAYAGLDGDGGHDGSAGGNPWALLLGSDDPATSTLARWWGSAA